MSRTVKKPSHWWRSWWKKSPWRWTCGRDDHRYYKIYRKQLQRAFRQATRRALRCDLEVPDQPPINWWLLDSSIGTKQSSRRRRARRWTGPADRGALE